MQAAFIPVKLKKSFEMTSKTCHCNLLSYADSFQCVCLTPESKVKMQCKQFAFIGMHCVSSRNRMKNEMVDCGIIIVSLFQ